MEYSDADSDTENVCTTETEMEMTSEEEPADYNYTSLVKETSANQRPRLEIQNKKQPYGKRKYKFQYSTTPSDTDLPGILEASLTHSYSDPEVNRHIPAHVRSESESPGNFSRYEYKRTQSSCSVGATSAMSQATTDTSLSDTIRQLSRSGTPINIAIHTKFEVHAANCETVSVGSSEPIARQKIPKSKTVARKNIIVDTKASIKHHIDRGTYHRTRAFNMAKQKLTSTGVAIIIGYPGDGNSSLAIELLRYYQQGDELNESKTPVALLEVTEWRYLELREKLIVLIDDAFKLDSCIDSKQEKLYNMLLAYVENDSIFLILTINKFVYNTLKSRLGGIELFTSKSKCIVDLSDPDIGLSISDKRTILANHLEHMRKRWRYDIPLPEETQKPEEVSIQNGQLLISPTFVNEVAELPVTFGYPRCCAFLTKHPENVLRGIRFFSMPNEIHCDVINSFKANDPAKYLICIMVLVNNGLSRRNFKQSRSDPFSNLGVFRSYFKALNISYEELNNAIPFLENVLIKFETTKDSWYFVSEAVAGATLIVLGKDHPQPMIKYCSSKALENYFSVDLKKDRIHFAENHFGIISSRFMFEIKAGNALLVAHHALFDNDKFVVHFFQYLRNSGQQNVLLRRTDTYDPSFLFLVVTNPNGIKFNLLKRVLGSDMFNLTKQDICYTCFCFRFRKSSSWAEQQLYACLYYACVRNNVYLYHLIIDKIRSTNRIILMKASRHYPDQTIYNDLIDRFNWPTYILETVDGSIERASFLDIEDSSDQSETQETIRADMSSLQQSTARPKVIDNVYGLSLFNEAQEACAVGPWYPRCIDAQIARTDWTEHSRLIQ